ncbi:hypothetical protein SAMN04488515_2099 [Cognatiyoonia koreensis]|uniref:Uncharacterized protein n=1 Tax=Cognatiyoonia koreensis TaxID=364200 RepID=A0A1I0QQR9_9RHOB|nr:hypothetical protein [Cognatiyoonia koreensis]SEW29691.1 hypothetical protein SAMN04488515_2099 [Cognatiyoonia koreensis]
MIADGGFGEIFSPLFWGVLVALTIVMIVAGYWLGGVIRRRTNTGVGAFFVHLFISLSVAGGVLPLVVFVGAGDTLLQYDAFANPDLTVNEDEVLSMAIGIFRAIGVASLSVFAYFIAGLVGMMRGGHNA